MNTEYLYVFNIESLIIVCVYRAAQHGNIESLIKLGVAYLYNEGCKFFVYISPQVLFQLCF